MSTEENYESFTSGQAFSALCSACRVIDWHEVLVEERNHVFMHSVPSLKESALHSSGRDPSLKKGRGCPLCALIYNSLLRSIDDDPDVPLFHPVDEGQEAATKITTKAFCNRCLQREEPGMLLIGTLRDGKVGVLIPCFDSDEDLTAPTRGKHLTPVHHYAKMTLSRDPSSPVLSWKDDLRDIRNKRSGNPSLANGWMYPAEMIRSWINHCVDNHPACYQAPPDEPLPTRVLDVGTLESPQLRVLDSAGLRGSWVALSHCWGGDDPARPRLRTTTETLARFKAGLPFEEIPRVIQDAVLVTRGLGMRYLWVDLFCIVQDSTLDWDRESATMASVYRNSYVTIAASGASSSHDSLYLEHFQISSFPVPVHLGDLYEGGKRVHYLHCARLSLRKTLERDALQQRAWTLQETQLAVRVLYFSQHELFWQCRQGVTRELTPTQYIIPADPLGPRRMFDSFVKWPVNIFARWNELVEDFTSRRLTYRTDALPAMSGLASELALFLRSRGGREIGNEEQHQVLREPVSPPHGFPTTEGPMGSSMYMGLTGVPVNDEGNGALAGILDQVEFARRAPLPGYEDIPLRMDAHLSAHFYGTPIGPHGDGRECSHEMTDEAFVVMRRIAKQTGCDKLKEALLKDQSADGVYHILTEPAAHAALQQSFKMIQDYFHGGIEPPECQVHKKTSSDGFPIRSKAVCSCEDVSDREEALDDDGPETTPSEALATKALTGDSFWEENVMKVSPPPMSEDSLGSVLERMMGMKLEKSTLSSDSLSLVPSPETFEQEMVHSVVKPFPLQEKPDSDRSQACISSTPNSNNPTGISSRPEDGPKESPEFVEQGMTITTPYRREPSGHRPSLYFYPKTPFPAAVEWQTIAEDDCYLAGLWRVDLWEGLSWYRDPHHPPGSRPAQYRAPSWSWASLDCGGVRFQRGLNTYTRQEDDVEIVGDMELVEAHAESSGVNRFGHVRSGRLVVLGRIVDLPFYDDYEDGVTPRQDGVDLGDNVELAIRDEERGFPPFCRCIVIDHRTNLVVEPWPMLNGGCPVYRRVGLWMRDRRDHTLLDGVWDRPKEMITLF
ncbi:heterokaryon incompatibility protein-domain-containing protein [Xylaria scruposa]|nr:heterokaryon incompatibility protein-domain-containing protein [Xylaria scruposa]